MRCEKRPSSLRELLSIYGIIQVMQPTQAQLDELVQRIVDTVHPLRIILFG